MVRVPEVNEETALGTAIFTEVGTGHYPNISAEAEAWFRWKKRLLPT